MRGLTGGAVMLSYNCPITMHHTPIGWGRPGLMDLTEIKYAETSIHTLLLILLHTHSLILQDERKQFIYLVK